MSGAVVVLVLPHQQHQQQQQHQVMLLNGYGSGEQGSDESLEQAQELLSQDKKSLSSMLAQRAMHERRLKPPDHIIPCPRCQSINTKFCYYNNYSLTQPRHFCKNCRRYWTAGGTLRNVPVGGGCRKNKRVKRNSSDASNASSSVESSVCGFRSDGVNGGASQSVHQSFLQGGSGGSSFFESPPYDEATKAAIARAQQVIRAGSSGVGHSSHESSPGSDGPPQLSAPSLATQPFDSGIMSQGFFAPATKHDGPPTLSNGDLSSIFEAHAYRAAAAAAAGAGPPIMGGEGLNGYSHHHVSDVEGYGGGHHHVEADGHGHWRMQHKPGDMWEEEQPEREEAMLMPHSSDHHRKSSAAAHAHTESLRQALKGKSTLCLSPSSGLDEEGSSPCSVWAPTNPSLNPYESAQDAGFNWPGSWNTPLELMPASGVQFGMRSEHLFDLPKQSLVNPVGFGLDEFHSDNRKLA